MTNGKGRRAALVPFKYSAIFENLEDQDRLRMYDQIYWYQLDGTEKYEFNGLLNGIWQLIKDDIDNMVQSDENRRKANAINGKLGGRPKKEISNDKKVSEIDNKHFDIEHNSENPNITQNATQKNPVETQNNPKKPLSEVKLSEVKLSEERYIARNSFDEVPLTGSLRHINSSLQLPDVLQAWREVPEAPSPGDLWRFSNRYGREILQLTEGVDGTDYIQAIKNYSEVRNMPNTWWNSNPDIMTWTRKHLDRFLPGNYRRSDYEKEPEPETWDSFFAKEEAKKKAEAV